MSTAPVPEIPSVSNGIAADEDLSHELHAEPASGELETESETVESEEEQPPQTNEKEEAEEAEEAAYAEVVGFSSVLLFGGALMAGLAYFLSQPLQIQHPYS
jgi:hypothetical protein